MPGFLVILLTLVVLFWANASFMLEISLLQTPGTLAISQMAINQAIAVDHLTTDDAVVGVFQAGAVPYYTGRVSIDFLGKSDGYIAELAPDLSGAVSWGGPLIYPPGHVKYDLDYSIKLLQPTYVENLAWGSQDLSEWAESVYTAVDYHNTIIYLLQDSDAVLWDEIDG